MADSDEDVRSLLLRLLRQSEQQTIRIQHMEERMEIHKDTETAPSSEDHQRLFQMITNLRRSCELKASQHEIQELRILVDSMKAEIAALHTEIALLQKTPPTKCIQETQTDINHQPKAEQTVAHTPVQSNEKPQSVVEMKPNIIVEHPKDAKSTQTDDMQSTKKAKTPSMPKPSNPKAKQLTPPSINIEHAFESVDAPQTTSPQTNPTNRPSSFVSSSPSIMPKKAKRPSSAIISKDISRMEEMQKKSTTTSSSPSPLTRAKTTQSSNPQQHSNQRPQSAPHSRNRPFIVQKSLEFPVEASNVPQTEAKLDAEKEHKHAFGSSVKAKARDATDPQTKEKSGNDQSKASTSTSKPLRKYAATNR